jgi:hypothetical protein
MSETLLFLIGILFGDWYSIDRHCRERDCITIVHHQDGSSLSSARFTYVYFNTYLPIPFLNTQHVQLEDNEFCVRRVHDGKFNVFLASKPLENHAPHFVDVKIREKYVETCSRGLYF